jgi:CheY-like chemotaxis protein
MSDMSDKRRYPRLEIKGSVKIRVPETMDISIASLKNISAGGLCLMSVEGLTEGGVLNLEFGLHGDKNPIVAKGFVKWSELMEPPSGRFTHRVGIEFIEIDEEKQRQITEFVIQRMRDQMRDEIKAEKPVVSRRMTLLVIDDDRVVLKLVEDIFRDSFNVITASDGYAGIEKAKEWRPDLILLDIIMPDLDGFSTLMLLKDFPETADIPVIMLSMLRQKSKIFQAIQHGASDYIIKPFTSESLFRKIRKVALAGLKQD